MILYNYARMGSISHVNANMPLISLRASVVLGTKYYRLPGYFSRSLERLQVCIPPSIHYRNNVFGSWYSGTLCAIRDVSFSGIKYLEMQSTSTHGCQILGSISY